MTALTDEAVNKPEIKSLIKKITIITNPKAVKGLDIADARVVIESMDGKHYSADANVMKQIPPLNEKRVKVRAKFIDLVTPSLGSARTKQTADAILKLETFNDLSKLMVQARGKR
jgi:hypothetical protein